MMLVDDILFFPARSLFWIFEEIRDAALQEIAGDRDTIMAELSELYRMLETGRMTEEEFGTREEVLLNRLDALEEREDDVND
ncbi:MAG: gas vesicle protein GvpG [Nitrospirae bacterium]|nr:gas vesicle protein GvpG [Nitrospirota bacterium]